jgi:hypothetical protein
MPLIEAGFKNQDGTSNIVKLLTYGPTITVVVGHVPPQNIENSTVQQIKSVSALIDTGASNCMIDTQLAKELNLIAVDKALVAGVNGSSEHLIYMAAILVPQLDIHQFGKFLAANLKDGGQDHEVLLGRDFLANTVMIYDGVRAQITIASAKK